MILPEYYEPTGAEYIEGLPTGHWTYLVEDNAVPCMVMADTRPHPLLRLTCSFFILGRAGDGGKNLGFAFVAFRDRRLMNRYYEIMNDTRITPWSEKRLTLSLARDRNLDEVTNHFVHQRRLMPG